MGVRRRSSFSTVLDAAGIAVCRARVVINYEGCVVNGYSFTRFFCTLFAEVELRFLNQIAVKSSALSNGTCTSMQIFVVTPFTLVALQGVSRASCAESLDCLARPRRVKCFIPIATCPNTFPRTHSSSQVHCPALFRRDCVYNDFYARPIIHPSGSETETGARA